MIASVEPLLALFLELRRRNFPLGVQEYLLAIRALASGFEVGSRAEVADLCATLWAKSPEERAEVAEVVEMFPPRWTAGEMQAILVDLERAYRSTQAEEEDKTGAAPRQETSGAAPPASGAVAGKSEIQAEGATAEIRAPTLRPATAAAAAAIPALSGPGGRLDPSLDFAGMLPVTRRQMKRAWRYYRRMQRLGPPVDLDVDATIAKVYRQGVYDGPVLLPRRINQARIVLLQDEGGSMAPFRRITQPLLESARQNGLARVEVFYFHDVPGDPLFTDPYRTRPIPRAEALAPFARAGVLIISDGGAARQHYDAQRALQTIAAVEAIKAAWSPNIAWLNPTPESRWAGSSAGAVRAADIVPMFTLDRAGLDAAVDVLRGRKRR